MSHFYNNSSFKNPKILT